MKKNKSVTIRSAWITFSAVLLAAVIGGIFLLFSPKDKSSTVKNETNINAKDSSKINNVTKQNLVQGDYIEGDKNITTENTKDNNSSKVDVENNKENYNVTSYNQQGGITAGKVNIYQEKPLPPLKDRTVDLLNKINPKILTLLKTQNQICVCINQIHINKLIEIEDSLLTNKILSLKSTGGIAGNNTCTIGNCINDISEGMLQCYLISKLDNFDKTIY
ncbi:MAG: hypothetical protein WC599_13870 [Bacteroidales bacterium]